MFCVRTIICIIDYQDLLYKSLTNKFEGLNYTTIYKATLTPSFSGVITEHNLPKMNMFNLKANIIN